MGDYLAAKGIKAVQFHGGISIKKRVKAKDGEFVTGKADHLLATKACAKSGYNLPVSDVVVFYDRSWNAKTEGPAMHLPMRVERKALVRVVFFHIPGSLDLYQNQMASFKADSARPGLDGQHLKKRTTSSCTSVRFHKISSMAWRSSTICLRMSGETFLK